MFLCLPAGVSKPIYPLDLPLIIRKQYSQVESEEQTLVKYNKKYVTESWFKSFTFFFVKYEKKENFLVKDTFKGNLSQDTAKAPNCRDYA